MSKADHGKPDQLIQPIRGFKTLKSGDTAIAGFEVMRGLRKGRAALFTVASDIRGEEHIIEQAFRLSLSAFTCTTVLRTDTG